MTSSAVIQRYLVVVGLYTLSASLIWGVNTLFLLHSGLDLFGVFAANAVFTGADALFEIPTGVLADTRGRRVSLLLSIGLLVSGTIVYVVVGTVHAGLGLFCLASAVLGLGFSFYSGAVEAWLVDALRSTGDPGPLDAVFARASFVSGAAMLVGAVAGGLLGGVDLALPFLIRAALLAIVFAIAFVGMPDIGFRRRPLVVRALPAEMHAVAAASVRYGWRVRSVRLLVLTSFVQSVFMAWGFYAGQPHFLSLLGRDAPWIAGVIAALVSLSMMAGNSIVEWFTRSCGRRTTLLLAASAVIASAAVGVGLARSFWLALPLYLVSMAGMGVFNPVKQAYLHQVIPSEQRATGLSFDSLLASGGSMVGQAGLGYLAQRESIGLGYIVGGLVTGLALPIVVRLRLLGEAADRIVGMAGKRTSCAAQGLPSVTGVESGVESRVS